MGRPLRTMRRGELFRLFPLNPRQVMEIVDAPGTMAIVVFEVVDEASRSCGERRAVAIGAHTQIKTIDEAAAGQLRTSLGEIMLPVAVWRKDA